jgi:hypothetical protein
VAASRGWGRGLCVEDAVSGVGSAVSARFGVEVRLHLRGIGLGIMTVGEGRRWGLRLGHEPLVDWLRTLWHWRTL